MNTTVVALLDDRHASEANPTSRLYTGFLREHRSDDPARLDETWAAVEADQRAGRHALLLADYEWGARLLKAGYERLADDAQGSLRVLMFEHCDILQFESGQLVLATPNAALAAKLKQQLPKLQGELERKGWQISGIKLKVQVIRSIAPIVHTRALVLPEKAMTALEELSTALPASKQNEQLIAALRNMLRHHREPKD